MPNQFQITLEEIDGHKVNLESMSSQQLSSFITVLSSLKSMTKSMTKDDDLTFRIRKGSAICEAIAPSMDDLIEEVELAINGQSDNKEITTHLRTIQDELKKDNYGYTFFYQGTDSSLNLHEKLKRSKRIRAKSKTNIATYKVECLSGKLNAIGGVNPNYHLDFSLGESLIINCSEEEAKVINLNLYNPLSVLVVCKEYENENKKDERQHKIIVEEKYADLLRDYLRLYYDKSKSFVEQLTVTYDFVYDLFDKEDREESLKILKYLLCVFNFKHFHLSEIKTLLVLSKSYKNHFFIKDEVHSLFETYLEKRK